MTYLIYNKLFNMEDYLFNKKSSNSNLTKNKNQVLAS
jgi:hypothetical protein